RAPGRLARPAAHPAASDPARPLRTPGSPACDGRLPRPLPGTAGACRARRMRGALDPAAGAAAHRSGRNAVRPHRARRGLADRAGRITGDRAGAHILSAGARRLHRDGTARPIARGHPHRPYRPLHTSPVQLAHIGAPILPAGYVRRLRRYRYGPGAFKVDWALDGPIPWRDPRCLEASTVHLGGTLDEIAASEAAVWRGEHSERPFVLLVQQSQFDGSRAPAGKHTGYAYCHVPPGSVVDRQDVIEQQIERFAPGFRDRILARHMMRTTDLERDNPNYLGGAITGGVADLWQFFTRPVARLDPYSTPNPRLFICSASTPPGGGVHGMCGYFAARSALRTLRRLPENLSPLR